MCALDFTAELRAHTERGVDVVLNPRSQDAIDQGLALLRPHGRFLELGKRAIHQNLQLGLAAFENGLSFSHIDIARLIDERPHSIGEMLRSLMQRVANAELQPLPALSFPASQFAEAFEASSQGPCIGKVVLSFEDPALANVVQTGENAAIARDDGCYLVTGGLSGLGLTTAAWLVEQGARQLVLLGRRAPSADATRTIAKLQASGARVLVRSCDAGDREQLTELLSELQREGLRLRGIVHSAGVLSDATVTQLTAASFEQVMRPKLHGAYNLHLLTRDLPLDFFVLYSSGAATLGSPGQGNYAAANAFMDALVQQRRTAQLPALSVNWGPWIETGLAVRPDRAGRLEHRGLGGMTNQQGLELLRRLLRRGAVNTAVFPSANWRKWREFYPPAAKQAMLGPLLREASSGTRATNTSELQRILAAEPEARAQLIESYLLEQMTRILKLGSNKALDPQLPLTKVGLDSLMALELKNRVEADLQVVVPVSKILLGPSTHKLARDVLEKLPEAEPTSEALAVDVAALSDAQVDALLGELLESGAVQH